MFAILTKTVFCLQFLLLERAPFSYMNGYHLFLFIYFSRRSYVYILHILVTRKSLAQKLLYFSRLYQILRVSITLNAKMHKNGVTFGSTPIHPQCR